MKIRIPADRLRIAALSALPMGGALLGGWLDERHHLGFTTWRTACRAAGLRIPTLIDFTLQLLPTAVLGLLLAGVAVLLAGAVARRRDPGLYLAAHAGCALSLPVGLVLCALLPPAVMLAADVALATLAALLLLALLRTPSRANGAHP